MALLLRQTTLRAAIAAIALLCASAPAFSQDATPSEGSPLTIISRAPNPEFRIHGVSLKSVRSDDAQNEVAFDFNGPVSDEAFARLQDELPDWIEIAYAGYDNAIIRAKRPVTFMTRAEADGFSMRIVPRAESTDLASVQLRGANDASRFVPPAPFIDTHGWTQAQAYFARAAAERPFDATIRRGYDAVRDGGASTVIISGDWRHTRGTMLITSNAHADIGSWYGVHLLGDMHDVVVDAKAVRRLGGTITPYNRNDLSGSAGLGIAIDGAVATAELLYGRSGLGGRIGINQTFADWQFDMRAAYHEPYNDTAEAVADRGTRDYSALYAAGQLFDGLWGSAQIMGTRYGVHADANVARTAGFHAGLRYDFYGWPLSLTYDADGEYVLKSHKYPGVAPTPFVPLSIRDREVHSLSGAFSDKWNNEIWFDLYGGYAIDRYSNDGPFGGVALRLTPGPGFDISLNGRYSTVADRQGEQGGEMTAGLTLTYAWGTGDAPILRAGPNSDL